jgi:RES domain
MIWQMCQGATQIRPLSATVTRIVESQEQVATTLLVDSAAEQNLLEQLLDHSKPAPPQGAQAYHYLLWTPFRYPPLPYGSRFGQRMQPGIFYASLSARTALAECAYYRLVFMSGMSVPPPGARLTTEHTAFAVQVDTARGVHLDAAPFRQHADAISHPARYDASQLLGVAMRDAGVAAFTYCSARDAQGGVNLGAFQLDALKSRKPEARQQWICTTTLEHVDFIEVHASTLPQSFALASFLASGSLPIPAC